MILTFFSDNYDKDKTIDPMLENEIFVKLMSNNEIKHKLAHTIVQLSLEDFEPNRVINLYNKYEREFFNDIANKDFELYGGKDLQKLIPLYSKIIKQFFINRPNEIYEKYCKDLDYTYKTDKEVRKVCEQYR